MIELPFPPKCLSPNGRAHWGTIATAKKKCRSWAKAATMAAKVKAPDSEAIYVVVNWHPKTKHAYDEDNCIAMCKAYFDGVADALGVNDSRFKPRLVKREPIKHGKVIIEILDQ